MISLRESRLTPQLIHDAICDCFTGKLKRNDVCKFLAYETREMFAVDTISTSDMKNFIAKYGFESVDKVIWYTADKYYDEIINQTVSFEPIRVRKRVEKTNGKERKLCLQSVKQLIFDYIAVDLMRPVFARHFGPYQCASIEGRGQTHAINAIRRWISEYESERLFYIKTDIKHYFNSINLDDLRVMLHSYVEDKATLYILFAILATYPEGLSIGSYLSQYLANLYMSDTYHYLAESMIKTRRGKTRNKVSHVLIYMDDILVFCDTITDAKHVYKKLEKYMSYKRLELHNTIIDEFRENEYIDIIGYRVYRNCVTMRKRNYKRMCNLIKHIKKHKLTLVDARAVTSYFGLCTHSDHNNFSKRFKFDRVVNDSKNLISDSSSIKKRRRSYRRYQKIIDPFEAALRKR